MAIQGIADDEAQPCEAAGDICGQREGSSVVRAEAFESLFTGYMANEFVSAVVPACSDGGFGMLQAVYAGIAAADRSSFRLSATCLAFMDLSTTGFRSAALSG